MGPVVGGWELANIPAGNLPEDVATAFSKLVSGMVGAKYVPVLYVGKQVVHGTNHMVLCTQSLAVPGASEHLVEMIINISGKDSSLVTIQQIV